MDSVGSEVLGLKTRLPEPELLELEEKIKKKFLEFFL